MTRSTSEAASATAAAAGSDVVEASVVTLAASRPASIVTGDPDDIERLVAACGINLTVLAS
jgi:hypothetical protein